MFFASLGGSRFNRILPFCSLSSSESLSRRRVPARGGGEGGLFVTSTSADLGLYLGKAELASDVRGRRLDARTLAPRLGLVVTGDDDCSSEDVVPLAFGRPDNLREALVIVLASGDAAFLADAAFSAAAREGGTTLLRLDDVSFVFLPFSFSSFSSFPLLSLCITSANAFPMDEKLSDCLIVLRVWGRERVGPLALAAATSVDMMVVVSGSER